MCRMRDKSETKQNGISQHVYVVDVPHMLDLNVYIHHPDAH